jgi:hypothetical protein
MLRGPPWVTIVVLLTLAVGFLNRIRARQAPAHAAEVTFRGDISTRDRSPLQAAAASTARWTTVGYDTDHMSRREQIPDR